jgi:lipoyl(octanoyl) transferase
LAEHPHVVTLGRRAKLEHLLLTPEALAARGIALCETNRGGDVTYHGPGQIVAYPIVDLQDWKKDVVAYVRALEQVVIDALVDFGIAGERVSGCTGVWVEGAKVAAIGVHVSRWITSHGFALNVSTDLRYFEVIIPCGLRKPVTSMKQLLGEDPPRQDVAAALVRHFGLVFGRKMSINLSFLRNG